MSNVVKTNEPDTINYQFYFDRSETRCIVYETYKNSEAVFFHINGIASKTILPRSMIYLKSRDLRFLGPEAKSYKKQWKD
jgi:quinol monooxygenase YgiN